MGSKAGERMSKLLAIAAVGLCCGIGLVHASEADWKMCESEGNDDGRISACARIISDAAVTVEERAGAYYVTGNIYAGKGDYAQAVANYDKAIGLNAKNAWYFTSRCWALTEKGETDRAILDCDKAIALHPKNALAYANRGGAKEAKGQTEQAIADYKAALAMTAETDDDRLGQEDAKAAMARLQKQAPKK
jgi:tetratricopeptide (TPR) repeat protein